MLKKNIRSFNVISKDGKMNEETMEKYMKETKALISAMTGESRGGSRAAAPGFGFSRGTMARSVSLSGVAREVGSPCEWQGGARHCSRVMVGESGLETC